jgi:cyclic pyranopterin phosphate synthase
MSKLSHLDDRGAARMVDVTEKDATEREACAQAVVRMSKDAFTAISAGESAKGDVLAAARIAGIMAAKKTSDLIPLCHPLALTRAGVDFELSAAECSIRITATCKTKGPTGVEMEALTAASIAALTIYDMIKAVDREAAISDVHLHSKSGGKSGTFVASEARGRNLRDARAKPTRKARVLMEAATPAARQISNDREAFRAFMTARRLRATEWARDAGVSPSQIYAFLTGRARLIPSAVAEKLARAANVRVEDMFR